jgi:outer membrane biogenesis lipoprotein LolB
MRHIHATKRKFTLGLLLIIVFLLNGCPRNPPPDNNATWDKSQWNQSQWQ